MLRRFAAGADAPAAWIDNPSGAVAPPPLSGEAFFISAGDRKGRPSVELSAYGTVIEPALRQTAKLYDIQIGHCVVMPNHIHFICVITEPRAATRAAPTIGQIVGAIKSISANRCREAGLSGKLWQRGYYEHVIRNEKDYLEICAYIENNPARWAVDRYYQA